MTLGPKLRRELWLAFRRMLEQHGISGDTTLHDIKDGKILFEVTLKKSHPEG